MKSKAYSDSSSFKEKKQERLNSYGFAGIDVGYFLPCKIAVYEEGGSVKIGIMNPETFIGMLGHGGLRNIAKEVQDIMITAINNAV